MREREPRRVEELPVETEVAADAVGRVACDGEADRRKVNADLVHTPGFEADAEECMSREQLLELEVCDGLARCVCVERLTRRVAAVTADRCLDPPGARPRLAPDEGDVLTLERTVADELLEAFVRLLRARHDEEARRVAVETVDDARAILVTTRRTVLDEGLRERAARVSRAGVHDDAGRLVDDEEVVVLVRDSEVGARLLRRGRTLGQLERDLLAGLHAIALRAALAVDGDRLRAQKSLGVGARTELVEGGEEAVEPRARGVSGDEDANDRTAPLRRGATRRRRR
jgi:hypothetical protein